MKIITILLLVTFLANSSLGAYKSSFARNYDTQHIKLKLCFDPPKRSLSGEATISLIPLEDRFSTLQFHARDLEIRDVVLTDRTPLSFLADSELLVISLPKSVTRHDTVQVIISYYAEPTAGIYFNEPTADKPEVPYQIYSHSEPTSARNWFPCYDEPDDKLTSEIIATVPENYYLISNGKLLLCEYHPAEHVKTFHWLQDKVHTTYLISITAGEFVELRDNYKSLPLFYYVDKKYVDIALNSFAKTPRMIQFFEQRFGYPYPWDKYAQVVVANYQAAGMEHTSATTLSDHTLHDHRAHLDGNSDDLVAHELAHQWFGNLVTCNNWAHIWLNEGFATYAEILFKEFDLGTNDAQYAVYQDQKFYLEMTEPGFYQPIVYEHFVDPDDMFNYLEYQKAGLVLHMLRYLIGDSLFFMSLSSYLKNYAYQSIETKAWQQIVEQVTGQNLDWFFNQWLYQGGHPQFTITSQWLPERKQLFLYVTQTQSDSLGLVPEVFKMPVSIQIIGTQHRLLEKIFLKSREDTFQFSFDEYPRLIRFDPDNCLLKEIKFIKSQNDWIVQLLHDEHVAGRLEAIEQLQQATFDTLQTAIALEHALSADAFWAVRKEAAFLLHDFHRPESKKVLLEACNDAHPQVRTAAISTLSHFYDPALNSIWRRMARRDSSYKVVAEALYALSNIPDDSSFVFLSQFVDVASHNDVVRTAAFHALERLKDERAIPIAIRTARDPRQTEYVRTIALSILKETGIGQEQVESTLIELLTDSNLVIKKKAIDALGLFKTERSLQALKGMEATILPDDVRRRLRISIEKIERSLVN